MPVTDTHAHYNENRAFWARCRDVVNGTDAVKAAKDAYLPKLDGQNDADYNAYRERAVFYGATDRTIQGLVGSVFRKPPRIDCPALMDDHLSDVTLKGESFEQFSRKYLRELLMTGRCGILVDMPETDMFAVDVRPYWVRYKAEDIINWRTRRVNGRIVLSMVVLHEVVSDADLTDAFASKQVEQYRVLYLDEGGKYGINIWRKLEKKTGGQNEWYIFSSPVPRIVGEPLDFIPFAFDPESGKPPLQELVDMNLSHYRTMADLEHGRHFTALPTLHLSGFVDGQRFAVGSAKAIMGPVDSKATFIEFTGQGLGSLERAAEEKEKKMAALGGRLLETQKAAAEAAETIRMRTAGEQSILADLADVASQNLSKALLWHAHWLRAGDSVSVQLNKDFDNAAMTPDECAKLTLSWQAGGISWKTLYHNLEMGELTRPGIDAEQELLDIQSERGAPPLNAA